MHGQRALGVKRWRVPSSVLTIPSSFPHEATHVCLCAESFAVNLLCADNLTVCKQQPSNACTHP